VERSKSSSISVAAFALRSGTVKVVVVSSGKPVMIEGLGVRLR
jgi:hypothetical protein